MKVEDCILVVKYGALGDVLRTSYILPGLQGKYPGARIYWVTADDASALLRYNPYVHHVCTPSHGYEPIKALRFNLVISLDEEVEALTLLRELRFRKVVGARLEGNGLTYCRDSAAWFDMGLISRFGKQKADTLKRRNRMPHHWFLEKMLGIKIAEPCFFNSHVLESRARVHFDKRFFNIGLASGAGSRWPSKQLRLEETVSLIRLLLGCRIDHKPVRVHLLGGRAEAARQERILQAIRRHERVVSSGEHDLLQYAAIVKCCDYVISSDSLPLHLAIAQKIPNLSFFAPTSAAEIGTFASGVKVVSKSKDYGSYRPDADNSTITAERIFTALVKHLRECGKPCENIESASLRTLKGLRVGAAGTATVSQTGELE